MDERLESSWSLDYNQVSGVWTCAQAYSLIIAVYFIFRVFNFAVDLDREIIWNFPDLR